MGNWLVPCPDCRQNVRFVLRPGKLYHRFEDATTGELHDCRAKVRTIHVEWIPCVCGAIVQSVIGDSLRNSDCTPHACAAITAPTVAATQQPSRPAAKPPVQPIALVPPGVIAR